MQPRYSFSSSHLRSKNHPDSRCHWARGNWLGATLRWIFSGFLHGFTVSKSHRTVSFFALKWLANHQISDLPDPTFKKLRDFSWRTRPPPSWRTPETLRTKTSSWTPPETDSAYFSLSHLLIYFFQVLGVLGPRLWEFLQSIPGLRNNWWSQLKSLVNGCEWCTSLKNPSCGDLYQY